MQLFLNNLTKKRPLDCQFSEQINVSLYDLISFDWFRYNRMKKFTISVC